MENIEKKLTTEEGVWAALQESERQRKEYERFLTEKLAETNQQLKETDMLLKETGQQLKETDTLLKESIAASEKRGADIDRRIKEVNEMIGGVSNSNGMAAEEFFINTIERGDRNIFGEHFTDCYSMVRRYSKEKKLRSEQDIILVNGEAVALVEVKYKAQKADIQKIINRLPSFRALHPEYKTHRIYLGLAAMAFDYGVEKEAEKEGVAVVKQVGNTFVIHDENMTVF